ncbi:Sec1-like protein, partial [Cinara cedri]
YVAAENDEPKEVVLDESDELWVKFRHEHIGVVTRNVTSDLKKFIDSNRVSSAVRDSHSTLRDFSKAIKAIPQYKKELSTHCTHLNMVQYCAEKYKDGMSRLCKVEQELALGTNVTGEKVDDHMKDIAPILLDKMVSNYDKVRIILLYVLSKNGISDESFNKMVKTAQLSPADKRAIVNLTLLGFNVVDNAKIKKPCLNKIILRGERHRDSIEIGDIGDTYEFSRWIPVVKYIMEDCIGNKLDPKRFPFVTPRTIITEPPPISARFSGGASNKKKENKQLNERLPKLIVFIIGGMTYSEMKCAYEVTNSTKNWEVIIGSSCIITPKDFIENLSNISQ